MLRARLHFARLDLRGVSLLRTPRVITVPAAKVHTGSCPQQLHVMTNPKSIGQAPPSSAATSGPHGTLLTGPMQVPTINMGPFHDSFPMMTNPKSIGQGVSFLNKHLCSRFFRSERG